VGRIGKPHGLHGDVVVSFVSNRPERVAPGAVLVTATGEQLVVASARPNARAWVVHFTTVTSREGAEALRGTVLRAEPIDDESAWWVHELVGAQVADGDGAVLGTVRAVVANPASDLLELDDGALVPLRFVVRREGTTVVVDIPDGLLDPPPPGGRPRPA